jgi:hypothetical protein
VERSVNYFTTAPAEARNVYERLMHTKRELGLDEPIHDSSRNPMVFFELPRQVA